MRAYSVVYKNKTLDLSNEKYLKNIIIDKSTFQDFDSFTSSDGHK